MLLLKVLGAMFYVYFTIEVAQHTFDDVEYRNENVKEEVKNDKDS